MAHQAIQLPAPAYEPFQDIQNRILSYEITPEMAEYETKQLIAPYVANMPGPQDTTEVMLAETVRSFLQ